jgi:predicted site-specific integrase-resolvase
MITYWTASTITRLAGTHHLTVYRWARRGRLKACGRTETGILLFDPTTVKKFLSRRAKQQRRRA